MTGQFLANLRVAEIGEETGRRAGRVLADMGATVTCVDISALRKPSVSLDGWSKVWDCGKLHASPRSLEELNAILGGSDVVIASADTVDFVPEGLHEDVVVAVVSPYGLTGPRSNWRGSDLTCLALSGNLNLTGDPDRPPIRPSQPLAYAHAAGDVAFGVLSAVATGRGQRLDISIHEALMPTLMSSHVLPDGAGDDESRAGLNIGRSCEVFRCADGEVIFGMRGGPSRAHTWQNLMSEIRKGGVDIGAYADMNWAKWDHLAASDQVLRELEGLLGAYFLRRTKGDLYQMGIDRRVMIAPIADAADVYESSQLSWRGFFAETELGAVKVPVRFGRAWRSNNLGDQVIDVRLANPVLDGDIRWSSAPARVDLRLPWKGIRLLELGSGIAGPMSTRLFVEQGAACVKVESARRPDVLRVYSPDPDASALFANVNPGKRSITIDTSHGAGKELVARLIDWCDAVVENFSPTTLPKWGFDPFTLVGDREDLIILRSSMWGIDGPDADYPGFGPQGTALSGYHHLTGWPDRLPALPYGTVTDTLCPRYSAAALAAALLARDRDGEGCVIDISQIEVASYTLSPWLYEHGALGSARSRIGNRHPSAAPHGVFPSAGSDRWVALAIWSDEEWGTLCDLIGQSVAPFSTLEERLRQVDAVETLVASWTLNQEAETLAELLQGHGLDAAPVIRVPELRSESQLIARGHYVEREHARIGLHLYERSSLRFEDADLGRIDPGPLRGEGTEFVLTELLGLSPAEIAVLVRDNVLV
jgi:crotonobetainyl-CoA:carnitine CoA-transferase CaiB-like acyl-CoA transferase